MEPIWQIAADTGGTFTDLIGTDPEGVEHRAKVLSSACLRSRVAAKYSGGWIKLATNWTLPEHFFRGFNVAFPQGEVFRVREYRRRDHALLLDFNGRLPPGATVELSTGEEAPILGARVMTGTSGNQVLPPIDLRLGTTRGTNALLERNGGRVAFFVTKGLADLLEIGDQRRPDIFALNIKKPASLVYRVIEVDGRMDANGEEISPISFGSDFEQALASARAAGCQSAAIALLHSYRNPAHEHALAAVLETAGFAHVACSSELAPMIKILPRAQTTVVDAYLAKIMQTYLDKVEAVLADGSLRIMTSAGGLTARNDFYAKDSLLSGPAGGVVGARNAGHQAGSLRCISFDMGGTSTDVARIHSDFDYRSSHQVGDAMIMAPALKIETVAAGGGSICGWDGRRLYVGPDSAGAHPGPACYGVGGPLTITDVNLLLGRLLPSAFGIPVFESAAERAADAIARDANLSRTELLEGFLRIANERMAAAIETISVREGYDPSEYALVAFGGAGGLHACAIAELLAMKQVIFPRHAGVLSAYGIEQAAIERIGERQVIALLGDVERKLPTWLDELASQPKQQLLEEGIDASQLQVRQQRITMRLAGQDSSLTIDHCRDLRSAFVREYQLVFGYFPEGRAVEVVSLQVVVSTPIVTPLAEDFAVESTLNLSSAQATSAVRSIDRGTLAGGTMINGPAIVFDDTCTLFVESGWSAVMGSAGTLKLSCERSPSVDIAVHETIARELFTNRFRQLVDEMGVQLERTAVSTNVKERLDFSCALLDRNGHLVVNAPHIPVHLGALGLCVRTVAEQIDLAPGDVVVTNHPGAGGSHLPDVTVITPIFLENQLLGYVANRAHHAEIGGIRPGSMPPNAHCLAEEGVVIPPTYLFRKGESRLGDFEQLLTAAPYPTRALKDNLADLSAQIAANRRGEAQFLSLVSESGADKVLHYMDELLRFSADALRKSIARLQDRAYEARSVLDDGTTIQVSVEVDGNSMVVDFAGTDDVQGGNLNASPAIVSSALIYVLRLLTKEDLPLNEGLLRPVGLRLPTCFLNPHFPEDPRQAPAVVGGNVETSQRVVECCLRALELVADSQGTMNNFIFGNDHLSYYETIGGGAGAGCGFNGTSGVHSHMTNTAITDPEILERRFPLRLTRFAIRKGSGGSGRWRGGDGLIREVEFLEPLSISLLTQHRSQGPRGLAGGQDALVGQQRRIHACGREEELMALADYEAMAGERLIIETPGGGGFGS
ncbi:MAG: hydantoinase B/oxoprolinase family protein [Verrucomicrobiota bacterium]